MEQPSLYNAVLDRSASSPRMSATSLQAGNSLTNMCSDAAQSSKWEDADEVGLALLQSRLQLIEAMREEAAQHCARFTRALEDELRLSTRPCMPARSTSGVQSDFQAGGRRSLRRDLRRLGQPSCLSLAHLDSQNEQYYSSPNRRHRKRTVE